MNSLEESKNGITVYCHFSFKRPKGQEKESYFAVAFYTDSKGKKLVAQKTSKLGLWKNHQFVTAIQSYEYALSCISNWQGVMKSKNINQVMLVTDNSTLAGWIENPKKNKQYIEYMKKASSQYCVGGPREIVIGIGLCEVQDYEKSYKFCKEQFVTSTDLTSKTIKANGKRLIDLSNIQGGYKTAIEMVEEDKSIPEVVGLTEQ